MSAGRGPGADGRASSIVGSASYVQFSVAWGSTLLLLGSLCCAEAWAQGPPPAGDAENLAKQLANPVADLISLTMSAHASAERRVRYCAERRVRYCAERRVRYCAERAGN